MTPIATSDTTQQFLSFLLPPDIQALLPTQQVIEILNLTSHQIVPIAQVPPEVLGVCNWRGEVLWLVDLAALIGTQVSPNRLCDSAYRPLQLHTIVVQHKGYVLGLVVEQIGAILRQDTSETYPILATPNPLQFAGCIEGCWLTPEGKSQWLLNGEALIEGFCLRRE
ncbi:MAG: chemotaxis protein CheW [Oculatellaceae cyanobacterium Prado106]|jgi:positive phototaxis protein PixI|nr:chemotaxis protein CheW [Oculatellaceae cyanobacterium Prado106]